MIKKIDNLGRIVVPKGFRQMLGLNPGDPLELEIDGDKLTISPHKDCCTFCGASSVSAKYCDKNICQSCIEKIRALEI